MKLYNIVFMLVLIAFPHSSFSNAKMGGDFSEDYFKKFEIDKVFKCKELSRNGVEKDYLNTSREILDGIPSPLKEYLTEILVFSKIPKAKIT